MKAKEYLKKLNITESTRYHSYDYLYKVMLKMASKILELETSWRNDLITAKNES